MPPPGTKKTPAPIVTVSILPVCADPDQHTWLVTGAMPSSGHAFTPTPCIPITFDYPPPWELTYWRFILPNQPQWRLVFPSGRSVVWAIACPPDPIHFGGRLIANDTIASAVAGWDLTTDPQAPGPHTLTQAVPCDLPATLTIQLDGTP